MTFNDDFKTSLEAARVLECSVDHLMRLRSQGRGPPYVRIGHGSRFSVFYKSSDLELWRNTHRKRVREPRYEAQPLTVELIEKALIVAAKLVLLDPKYAPVLEHVERGLEDFKKNDPREKARRILAEYQVAPPTRTADE